MERSEMETIQKIVNRAHKLYPKIDGLSLFMDLDCVHASGPLRLDDLLNADEYNFRHDVGGILRHLNRATKRLENCFLPRFTA